MASLIILAPLPASVSSSRGSGQARLLTDDPKEVWTDSVSGSAAVLTLDLGATMQIDSAFLGSSNAADTAAWTVSSGINNGTETVWLNSAPMPAPYRRTARPRMSFYRRAAPIAARYLSVSLIQPANSPPLTIGNFATGLAFQPTYGNEYGSGRTPIDTGSREALFSGGFGTLRGIRKTAFTATLGDLLDAEVERLDDIFQDKGSTLPVLFIEGTDATGAAAATAEQMHWSVFQKLEGYERQAPAVTRWGLTFEEWR